MSWSRITKSRASTRVTGEATGEAASGRSTPQPPIDCLNDVSRRARATRCPRHLRSFQRTPPIRSSHAFVAPSKSPPPPLLGPLRSRRSLHAWSVEKHARPALACIRARLRGDLHVHAYALCVGCVLAAFPRACDVMCAACVRVRACGRVWWKAEAACARRMGFMAGGRRQCVSATRCGRLLHSTPRSLPLDPCSCTVSQSSHPVCTLLVAVQTRR